MLKINLLFQLELGYLRFPTPHPNLSHASQQVGDGACYGIYCINLLLCCLSLCEAQSTRFSG